MLARGLVCAFACVLPAEEVVAQNQNITVRSRFDTRGRLSGLWGYVAPDGREFALVGENGGTWVVEITEPAKPVERGYFKAASRRVRVSTPDFHRRR